MKPRRKVNLIRRFLAGEEFYTNESPRITHAEIEELGKIGLRLQVEHTCGAQAGPIAVYPLIKTEFEKKAKEILNLLTEVASEKMTNLDELHKALDRMIFWWKTDKLTVCDPEYKENWIVETLDPQNFNSFADALDKFTVLFSVFSAGQHALRKLLDEFPTASTDFSSYVFQQSVEEQRKWLQRTKKVFDETSGHHFLTVAEAREKLKVASEK